MKNQLKQSVLYNYYIYSIYTQKIMYKVRIDYDNEGKTIKEFISIT